jgi:4-amino-4-deoxy-L-arabinose transferase-like glycosyltransferase
LEAKVNLANPVHKTTWLEAIGVCVLAMAGIGMAWLSWQKWTDPIIDFGRELYIPWSLCQGKVLYKDINIFFYGPLSYYLNALLFKIFGVHINTIIAFNLILICLTAVLIYKIIKFASSPLCAFFSALSFIILFAFPRYFPVLNDNFVTPYSHAATHGMTLSFLALFLVSVYLKTNRTVYACLCWFATGLVLLTKVEIFVGLFASMLVTWAWILHTEETSSSVKIAHSAVFASLLILPVFLAGAFFSRIFTFPDAFLHVLNPYLLMFHRGHSFSPLLVRVMGADQPLANMGRMLYWLVIYVLAALIVMALNRLLSALDRKTKYEVFPVALAFLVSIPFIDASISGKVPYLDFFLPLPLILLLHGACVISDLRKTQPNHVEGKKNIMSLSLVVFSFILLTRVFFNARVVHYGFFLVLPGFLILLVIILHRFPALMNKTTGDARFGMIPVIVLVVFTLHSYFFHSLGQYRLIDYPIKSNHEVIKTFDIRYADTGRIIQEAIDKINAVVEPDETLTAFPEGLMFNYLTRRESPSPYTAFLPTFFSVFHEDILESLQEEPPDFVLLVERSTSEYGYRYFGIDYATEVLDWIKKNYVEISQIGRKPFSGEGFGIILMKRTSS